MGKTTVAKVLERLKVKRGPAGRVSLGPKKMLHFFWILWALSWVL